MRLAALLTTWRRTKRITIAALASEIGIPPHFLKHIEQGCDVDGPTKSKVIMWLLSDGTVSEACSSESAAAAK